MGFENRWDKPYVSGDATFGELVTSGRLRELSSYPRDSVLDLLGDIFRGYTDTKRSGVINGFGVAPAAANQTITIARGLGLSYSPVADILGNLAILPVPLEALTSVVLDDPDLANPRLDLIVARPNGALSDYATRQVMLADSTKTTASLPAKYNEAASIVAIAGTPAAVPAVPSGSIGDIPLAVVEVTAGAPHVILAASVFDVRGYLNPRVGGVSEYNLFCLTDAAGAATAFINESVTDPTLHVAQGIVYDTSVYYATIAYPKVFGTHLTEYFRADYHTVAAMTYEAGAGVTMWSDAANNFAAAPTLATYPTAIYNVVTVGFVHINNSGGAAVFAPNIVDNGQISMRASFQRTD